VRERGQGRQGGRERRGENVRDRQTERKREREREREGERRRERRRKKEQEGEMHADRDSGTGERRVEDPAHRTRPGSGADRDRETSDSRMGRRHRSSQLHTQRRRPQPPTTLSAGTAHTISETTCSREQ
jgi:hypothetical protein